jgi:hypothetical protein
VTLTVKTTGTLLEATGLDAEGPTGVIDPMTIVWKRLAVPGI